MAEPKPKFNPRLFLRTIDANEPLRSRLARQVDLMDRMRIFRANMGDACNYVRGCLTVLWTNEVDHDAAGFYAALRTAGYTD